MDNTDDIEAPMRPSKNLPYIASLALGAAANALKQHALNPEEWIQVIKLMGDFCSLTWKERGDADQTSSGEIHQQRDLEEQREALL